MNPRKYLVVAVAFASIGLWLSSTAPHRRSDPGRTWLGPLSPVAAQVQWVRADTAIQDGLPGHALDLMESAVGLDPHSLAAWTSLADHIGLFLASAEGSSDPDVRREWLEAALEVTRNGEEWIPTPGELAFHRGMLLLVHARTDETLPWDGGTRGLWLDAAKAFDEASALGHEKGAAAAAYARANAAQVPTTGS